MPPAARTLTEGTFLTAGFLPLGFAGAFAEPLAFGMPLALELALDLAGLLASGFSALSSSKTFSLSSEPSSVVWRIISVRKRVGRK